MEFYTPHKVDLPKELLVFFDNRGLTIASAGHLANLAKEYYQRLENEIEHMAFTNTTIRLITGVGEGVTIERAISEADFEKIPTSIERIAQAKALIAWLREAIKAHQELTRIVMGDDLDKYIKLVGVKLLPFISAPEMDFDPTTDDILASADEDLQIKAYLESDLLEVVDEYQRWYNNKLAEARKLRRRALGLAAIGNTSYRNLVVNEDEAAEINYRLHQLMSECISGVADDMDELRKRVIEEHDKSIVEYRSKYLTFTQHRLSYCTEKDKLRNQLELYVKGLRIIIPDRLKWVYQDVVSATH